MGFTWHEHTSANTVTQTLGGIVDGNTGQVRGTPLRMWSLIYAFEYLSNATVSTELVQRSLGMRWWYVVSTDAECQFSGGFMILFRVIVHPES